MNKSKPLIISPYLYPGLRIDEVEKCTIMNRYPRIKMTKETLLEFVAEECGVTVQDVVGKCRKREIVDCRHIYCGMAKKHLRITLTSIGELLGFRDHTTVRHALIKFRDRLETEESYRLKVSKLYEKLGI